MNIAEAGDPYELIQRLKVCEARIASEIAGWANVVLPQLSRERDAAREKERQELERKIAVISHKISVLRVEQRATISALIRAENEVIKLEKARGKLISLD